MTTFEDWHAINTLLMAYAEGIDAGTFSDVAALFEHATYRLARDDGRASLHYEGAAQVAEFFAGTKIHADGTPRTKHTITNVQIEVDGDHATSRCYVTVFQQTDTLPLQPIASGRYLDRFDRVDGRWRFADRVITGFLLGDRSQHVEWHEETTVE
jgi:3-phenylpropionate/cinnamic acid dioxygenase small subunit